MKNRVVHFLVFGVFVVLVLLVCKPQTSKQQLSDHSELQRLVRLACQSLDMKLEYLVRSETVGDAQSELVAQAPLIMLCTKGAVKLGLGDVDAYPSTEELRQRIRGVRAYIVQW